MPFTVRLILVALCMLAGAKAANAQTEFYRAPASEVVGAPGTLVRQELIDGAPLGATAYRVLYRSTGLDNKPILVSGVVIVPPGDPPPGGRPIVAWAHPTSGVVPRCAPSLAIFLFEQIQGLRSFVRDGYVVAATDYPGLGTPGPHPYLVGTSEARAVIDSVRVAATLPGAGGGKRLADARLRGREIEIGQRHAYQPLDRGVWPFRRLGEEPRGRARARARMGPAARPDRGCPECRGRNRDASSRYRAATASRARQHLGRSTRSTRSAQRCPSRNGCAERRLISRRRKSRACARAL